MKKFLLHIMCGLALFNMTMAVPAVAAQVVGAEVEAGGDKGDGTAGETQVVGGATGEVYTRGEADLSVVAAPRATQLVGERGSGNDGASGMERLAEVEAGGDKGDGTAGETQVVGGATGEVYTRGEADLSVVAAPRATVGNGNAESVIFNERATVVAGTERGEVPAGETQLVGDKREEENAGYYKIRSAIKEVEEASEAGEKSVRQKSVIQTDSELWRFILVPFIADKLYPDEKINGNITGLIKAVYPDLQDDDNRLWQYAQAVQWFVKTKRKYSYVISQLKHQVKAMSLLPQDAPVVAKDGEFAPLNDDVVKKSGAGEYNVSFHPFKYLEYDNGEGGEPVRRRDKNYVGPVSNTDEIVLALLQFDVPAFFEALKKLPRMTDGSDEVPVDFGDGVKGRLLLALSEPQDEAFIDGVFDIVVPEGYYINGDYFNAYAKPQFFLSEDVDGGHNIKGYQLFYPLAAGVVQDGQAKRVWAGRVRLPVRFERADVAKGINVKGVLQFEVCSAEGTCRIAAAEHSLRLKPSDKREASMYYNYVTQSFARIPREKNKKLAVEAALFDENAQTLTVTLKSSEFVSSVAVMAEDAAGSHFTNPRYQIDDDGRISAVFDAKAANGGRVAAVGKVAISAMTNEKRIVQNEVVAAQLVGATVGGDSAESVIFNERAEVPAVKRGEGTAGDALTFDGVERGMTERGAVPERGASRLVLGAFWFGVLLNLMPGVFFLFIRLTTFLWKDEKRLGIWARYAVVVALGLVLIRLWWGGRYFAVLYQSPWLLAAAVALVSSFVAETAGYMDYSLFRPVKRFFKRGVFMGAFTLVLALAFPMPYKAEAMNGLLAGSWQQAFLVGAAVWLGIMVLPTLMLLWRCRFVYPLAGFKFANTILNLFYLAVMLWLIAAHWGIWSAVAVFGLATLLLFLWRVFPQAVYETVRHTRSPRRKRELFFLLQRHWLAAVAVIYAMTGGVLTFVQPLERANPAVGDVYRQMAQNIANGGGGLLVVDADYSWQALKNRKRAAEVQKANWPAFSVVVMTLRGDDKEVLRLLSAYGRDKVPLNVIFTARYPTGLVVPGDLRKLDFTKALREWQEEG